MPKIIISYRRNDSEISSDWICEKLAKEFGAEAVFRDIHSIQPAENFKKAIGKALNRADVVVAVVGPNWTGSGKRIHEENDWVRLEIATALFMGIPILPVLVDNAEMPKASELPEDIREFSFQHSVSIKGGADVQAHFQKLIDAVRAQIKEDKPSKKRSKSGKIAMIVVVAFAILFLLWLLAAMQVSY